MDNSISYKVLAAVCAAILGPVAAAQEGTQRPGSTETTDEMAEIVVTGSRIVRSDYSADTPILTLTSEALKNTGDISLDQMLAKMPQAGRGNNQFFDASNATVTPTSSPGAATVNLRGLGANRTLVLLDGRRTQPVNANMVVDLNTIPTAAVESVEIITGGAAATYGADAVAGVVNFKLKTNFEGLTVDAQTGMAFEGDGQQTQVSALLGSNFADNRGNAMFGLTYSNREVIYQRDREFYSDAYTDPNTQAGGAGGGTIFPGFVASSVVGGGPGATQAAVNAVFIPKGYAPNDVQANTGGAPTFWLVNTAATTAAATLFKSTPSASGRPAPGYTGTLAPYTKILSTGQLVSNQTGAYLSLPLERYSLFSKMNYELNDHATVYAQATFDENVTRTQSGGHAPVINQWGLTVPVDATHPVPAELATLLASRSTPAARWGLNMTTTFMPLMGLDTTTNTYEMLMGVKGQIGFRDWTYDVFASRGKTSMSVLYRGYVDQAAYQKLIELPNYGANSVFENARTGLRGSCTSGLNPFVNTPVSQDCINILDSALKTAQNLDQTQIELNVQGGLMDLPAGELRFAAGAGQRENNFQYEPDHGMTTSNIVTDAVGMFDSTRTLGSIGVKEIYGEVLVPVINDAFMVKSLDLNAGYRYSDYDTGTGAVGTWKITGNWDVVDYVKMRGGYQVANRAPNVAELYQPAVFSTVSWPDHDPCSNLTIALYGNNAANANRTQVQGLCTALSGGFPIDSSYVGMNANFFAFGRDLTQGNLNVESEEAKTWTIGTVLQSPFEQEALRNLTLAVDYYKVTIEGAISPSSTAYVYQQCLNGFGLNPTYDPNNTYCTRIIRNPSNGFALATQAIYENLGAISSSGIDAQLDWSMTTPFFGDNTGRVFTNFNFNWLESYAVQAIAGGQELEYASSILSPYGSLYRWKLFSSVGYSVGAASVSMTYQQLPRTKNAALVTNPANRTLETGSYALFGLTGRWAVNESVSVRAGVENMFDRQPPRIGVIPGLTTASGLTDASSYDVVGRRFYIGATASF